MRYKLWNIRRLFREPIGKYQKGLPRMQKLENACVHVEIYYDKFGSPYHMIKWINQ